MAYVQLATQSYLPSIKNYPVSGQNIRKTKSLGGKREQNGGAPYLCGKITTRRVSRLVVGTAVAYVS
jgi:hypothetical protein